MKKFLGLVLIFPLLFVAGCSLKKAGNNAPTDSSKTKGSPDLPKVVNNDTRLVDKDAFSLDVPANWLESPALTPGISLMMVNSTETSTRPEVKKINFKSYFSISYATLDGQTFDEYVASLKKKLTDMVIGISFQDLNSVTIDGQPAKVFSASLTQQGVDFRLLIFVAEGKNKDVWTIPFNTLPERLNEYQTLFTSIATSFRAK